MMKKISFLLALVVMFWGNLLKAQYGPNDDLDGDGIINAIDLDDDNDGIPDCVENGFEGSVSNYFQINGSAEESSFYEITLTPNSQNKSGQAWSKGKVDFTQSFQLRFQAYLGTNVNNGADGIAIVFQNSPQGRNAIGNDGGSLGAGGIQNGIALELDTYANTGFPHYDPSGSHGHGHIWRTSDLASYTSPINLGNLKNGNWHNVEITWNKETQTLSYTVNGTTAGTRTFTNIVSEVFGGGDGRVYFGYTASTGLYTNLQKVRFVNPCIDLPMTLDTDGDGIPDYLDLDSDNDGCPDAIEGDGNIIQSQLDADGRIIGDVDANGIPTVVGSSGQGIGSAQNVTVNSCPIPCTGPDSDGDGIPDMCDDDADNDGIPNCIENGFDGDPNTAFKSNGHATAFTNPSGGSAPTYQFRLTNGGSQSGQAWSYGKIDFAHSFKINMKVLLSGADGIAIVFHNDPLGTSASGIKGQGLGARGIANGIALELDTFPNSCDPDPNNGGNCDPSYDHGSIRKTAGTATTGWERLTPTPDTQLGDGTVDDGLWHDVEVSWNAITRNLSYTFDGAEVTNFTFPTSGPNALETIFGGTTNVHFGFTGSTGLVGTNNSIGFNNPCEIPLYFDTDGDGIPDYLDLDSDNDGCLDALEGDQNITTSQLVNAGGTVTVGTGSTASNQNLCAGTTCVDANGIPTVVNGGQGIGSAQDATVNACVCTQPGATGTPDGFTKVGITVQQKQDVWPENIPNGWIALESKEKGFVITRVSHVGGTDGTPASTDAVTNPKEGMVVYDIADKCVKLYNGTVWNCIQKSCNE